MPQLDGSMPSSLLAISRTMRLGQDVPALVVQPEGSSDGTAPCLLWLHGRTAKKEFDPGRYLRLARAGIGSCSLDLPGHGERFDPAAQHPESVLATIEKAANELDDVLIDLGRRGEFDLNRVAIGGMSMGGMAVLLRLCRPNQFRAAILEAASGSWSHQVHRQFFDEKTVAQIDPLLHLEGWREIPLLAVNSRNDEWVSWKGQEVFLDALKARYHDPSQIETLLLERTGAQFEHIGFGTETNTVRVREIEFLCTHLLGAE